jgi:uncharacterized FAD-dependent dehydrogenase
MIRINQIKFERDPNRVIKEDELRSLLLRKAAKLLRVSEKEIASLRIVKRSLDARKKPQLFEIYTIDVTVKGKQPKIRDKNITEVSDKKYDFRENAFGVRPDGEPTPSEAADPVVVIGSGPAGLFCAYELVTHGVKVVLLERGSDVDKRREIVQEFFDGAPLNLSTNVQFGEGGAGTFSDGKLNTVVKDKAGRNNEVLRIFVENGAPERIQYEAKPHIGTDILCGVVKNIRKKIEEAGGTVLFDTKVTDLVSKGGRLTAVMAGDKEFKCSAAVLAIGHSARDTFYMLKDMAVDMQPKPFAVGFRVEHPQSIINKSQYGIADPKGLEAAPYKLTATTQAGRGVYSFCMCPGGYVVNASSEEGRLAVNGMSYSGRDGKNANSAIIITVDPKDFGSEDVLSGVEFQRGLEEKAYNLAGGKIPVEYYGDFKAAVTGSSAEGNAAESRSGRAGGRSFDGEEVFLPQMKGAYAFAEVHRILPKELNEAFVEGMERFGHMIRDYDNEAAIVSGVESRTSSPVRINRGDDGQSVNVKGLYPCGEGAGYAGGIMSAAMDGVRIAELVAGQIR